jgi:hypothetical protein
MRSTAFSLRLAGAALLILAAAPVAAADTAVSADSNVTAAAGGSTATPATPAAEPKKEKKICRFDTASGSHLRGTKICMTRAEWRARTQ